MTHLLSVDNGGTFTDVCVIGDGTLVHAKSLTTPYDLTKCLFDALEEASVRVYGEPDVGRLIRQAEYLRYSTTAGTNAMVQRTGPQLGLIIRKSWSSEQLQRSDVERQMFETLVGSRVAGVETDEATMEASIVDAVNALVTDGASHLTVCLDGPSGAEDEVRLKRAMLRLFPRHYLGAVPVLYSHELIEDPDDERRTWTSLINAFLHPTMENFLYNAEKDLQARNLQRPMLIFGSDGSSTRVAKTTAIKTYSSGPRGGLEGAAALASRYGIDSAITLDVGGTTTDVAQVERCQVPERDPGDILRIPVSFRLGDVVSSGTGGSSVFSVDGDSIKVGPRSVGAVPGPACFGRGGTEPTITDAYLLMGILDAHSYFGGTLTLDAERAKEAITQHVADPLGLSVEEAVLAMEAAFSDSVARSVRDHCGVKPDTALLAFGGAGPIGACGVAESSGITDLLVPRMASVLSAFGISFSDISHAYRSHLGRVDRNSVSATWERLRLRAERDMFAEGYSLDECTLAGWIKTPDGEVVSLAADGTYDNESLAESGGWLEIAVTKPIPHYEFPPDDDVATGQVQTVGTRTVLTGKNTWEEVGVVALADLTPGTNGVGPLIIEDDYFTSRVGSGWRFQVTANHDIRMRRR